MDTRSPTIPPESRLHAFGRDCKKAVAFVVLFPFMFISPGFATRALESVDRNLDAPAKVDQRRRGEAAARLLRAKMTPADWSEVVNGYRYKTGSVIEEWDVANRHLADHTEAELHQALSKPPPSGQSLQGQALTNHKCGKCDRPLSPAWVGRCMHCGAKYAEFAPTPRT